MIWEELGLPKLKPRAPWFGYSLGEWSDELDAAAERATRGDYLDNGEGAGEAPAQGRGDEHRGASRQRALRKASEAVSRRGLPRRAQRRQ